MTAVVLDLVDQRFRDSAACAGLDANTFIEHSGHKQARKVCVGCPVAAQCFFSAILTFEEGTWGGVYLPGGNVSTSKRLRRVDRRDPLVNKYRSLIAARLGMTREQFVKRYGESVVGIREALVGEGSR
jgi:Transcription factor WhiB